VRQVILGEDNPASKATYTHKFCFRSLIPMDKARAVLGEERTQTRFMYNGPNAHSITYPVARGSLLNALFVISDPEPWTHPKHTATGTKSEAVAAYRDWHPAVCGLVSLLPDEKLDKWALFDMYEHPADRFNVGAVALAGDAAHAAGPHLGSGAGFGIEDALVLASILEAADRRLLNAGRGQEGRGDGERVAICHEALAAYNEVRFERDQWLPGATREAVELFQGRDEEVAKDPSRYLPRVARLYHAIWDNDIDEMVKTAVDVFERRTSRV
jgi:salicylate hydroxylase